MSELTPITRIESYLDAIINSGIPPTEDITRIETFLQAIYDNQVCALTPITRIEMFLGKISGQDIVLPEPITRVELYLAAIAGEDVELPENPITRIEMYLADWADSGDWTTISGAIVEFIAQRAHKLKSCVVNLSPKQDLHGYDSPWPAGGGKNLVNLAYGNQVPSISTGQMVSASGWSCDFISIDTSKTYTLSFVGTSTQYVLFYDASDGYLGYVSSFASGSQINSAIYFSSCAKVKLRSDSPQETNPLMQLEIGSTATEYAPYSNICPISGWTGCEVNRTGKNLIEVSDETNTYKGNGQYFTLTYGENLVTFTPTVTGSLTAVWKAFVIKQDMVGQKITFSRTVTGGYCSLIKSDTDGEELNNSGTLLTQGEGTWIIDQEAVGRAIGIRWTNNTGEVQTLSNVMINFGETASAYEPYRGNSYSVTFGEAVYGGYDEIVSGQGKDDRGVVVYSDSSGFVAHYSGRWYHNGLPSGADYSKRTQAISNQASYNDAQNTYGAYFAFGSAGVYINKLTADETIEEFLARLTANPFQICYFLSTPTDITTTPTPITALKGYNAMWSDGGVINVTVRGTPVELSTQQALNMLLGGAYHNNQTADDVSDEEALDIILGGDNK